MSDLHTQPTPEEPLDLPSQESCPYCGARLQEWEPSPYHCWENNLLFCPSDHCDYFRHGRRDIAERFNKNFAYRYCYDPVAGTAFPLIAWCSGERSYLKGRCSG